MNAKRIKKYIGFLFIFSLIVVAAGCSLFPSDPKGSIDGYVFVPVGNNIEEQKIMSLSMASIPEGYEPLSGAKVTITGSSTVATTDVNGYYRINDIKVGNQKVTIAKDGFETKTVNVEVNKNKITSITANGDMLRTAKDWTVLVYIAGDNDLSPYAKSDINEMETVGSDENVNIIVRADFSENENYDNGPEGTYCYYIEKDDSISSISSPLIFAFEEADSGDHTELAKFIEWGTQMYPAKKYAIVIWNHGAGWKSPDQVEPKSIAWDDVTGSCINTMELKEVMANSPVKFDLVGFDACLMGSVEMSYQLKDYASVLVGSELNEPGDGWPWDTVMAGLVANPQMDEKGFGEVIVDRYSEFYSYVQSMAAVDLSKMNQFAASLDKFALKFLNDQSLNKEAIFSLLLEDISYDSYYDLEDFMKKVDEKYSNAELSSLIAEVNQAMDEAIVKYDGREDLCGLSIQLMAKYGNYDYFKGFEGTNYTDLDFAQDTQWDEFLVNLWTPELSNSLTGRVVVNGEAPAKEVVLKVTNTSTEIKFDVLTNADGYYEISSDNFGPGNKLSIFIPVINSFSESEIIDNGLVLNKVVYAFETGYFSFELPDIDLYSYGCSLTSPEHNQTITLPHVVEYSKYNRPDVGDIYYYLSFYDEEGNYIDDMDGFAKNNTTFTFDGSLYNGGILTDNSMWNLAAAYYVGDFIMASEMLGNWINLESNSPSSMFDISDINMEESIPNKTDKLAKIMSEQ